MFATLNIGYDWACPHDWYDMHGVFNTANSKQPLYDTHGLRLGSTPDGRDWCIKALNPADPISQVRGIPDETAFPSVFINYQHVFKISSDMFQDEADSWAFDAMLMPHPITPLYTRGRRGTETVETEHMNTQLVGTYHQNKYTTLTSQFSAWRLAYCGITAIQDGPDLSNQGNLVSCQLPLATGEVTMSAPDGMNGNLSAFRPIGFIEDHTMLQGQFENLFDTSQSMPNAYFGRSRDGAYLPLKLSRACQEYRRAADGIMWGASPSAYSSAVNIINSAEAPPGPLIGAFPFLSLQQPWCEMEQIGEGPMVASMGGGGVTSKLCNDTFGYVGARNLSPATSFTFTVRTGWEMRPRYDSSMATVQRISPCLDDYALQTYYRISREMKDAYPASFNDASKVLTVIASILRATAPGLAFVPSVGPMLSAGSTALAGLSDSVGRYLAERKQGKQVAASAGDKERIQAAIKVVGALGRKGNAQRLLGQKSRRTSRR